MRAVVLGAGGLPELADLPEPSGPGELVRVRACGLCGSDVEKLGRRRRARARPRGRGRARRRRAGDGRPSRRVRRVRALSRRTRVDLRRVRHVRIEPAGSPSGCARHTCIPLPGRSAPRRDLGRAARVRAARGRRACRGASARRRLRRGRLLWVQVLVRRGDEVVVADPRPERLARRAELGAVPTRSRSRRPSSRRRRASMRRSAGSSPAARCSSSRRRGGTVPTSLDAVYRKELRVVGLAVRDARRSIEPRSRLLPSLVLPAGDRAAARAVRGGRRAVPKRGRR